MVKSQVLRVESQSGSGSGAQDSVLSHGALSETASPHGPAVLRHLRIGWWMLLMFVTLGILLESLHGFKVDFYLSVARAGTRTLWTLAHAVGTIIALLHIAIAASLVVIPSWRATTVALISASVNCASILLPAALLAAGLLPSERSVALAFLWAVPGLFFLLLTLLLTARGLQGSGGEVDS